MPDDLTIESLGLRPEDRIDHMATVAQQAAALLAVDEAVEVGFAPGDATQYQLLFVKLPTMRAGSLPFFTHVNDAGSLLVVPLNLPGRPMVWRPARTVPGEIMSSHGLTTHERTGDVYAAFLSFLARELVMADDRVTPEMRLRRVLGKLPSVAVPRRPARDASLDEILDVLEAAIEGNTEVLANYERDRMALHDLRADVAAMRRLLGTGTGAD